MNIIDNQHILLKECSVCSMEKQSGIVVAGTFICKECEQGLVEAQVDDFVYPIFVERLSYGRSERLIELDAEVRE